MSIAGYGCLLEKLPNKKIKSFLQLCTKTTEISEQ